MGETKYLKVYAEDYGGGYSTITFPQYMSNTKHPCVRNEELFLENSLIEKAREDGRNEAWELARKINKDVDYGGLSVSELRSIFGTSNLCIIYRDNTYSEAITKYNAWEDSNKIHIWDEVRWNKNGEKGIVIDRSNSTGDYQIRFDNRLAWLEASQIKKTGRRREIG